MEIRKSTITTTIMLLVEVLSGDTTFAVITSVTKYLYPRCYQLTRYYYILVFLNIQVIRIHAQICLKT